MSYPLPTFLPPEPGSPHVCETWACGRLLRADSPALLRAALDEAIYGILPAQPAEGQGGGLRYVA